jgi:hypothetical protein
MTLNRLLARRARRRPALETLEDRCTPATLVGLTANDVLLTFDSAAPGLIHRAVKITGLAPREDILGIDSRPANGLLYGVSSANKLYTISPYTGAATQVGGPFAVPLAGFRLGIDFNPTVDRLRLVTNTGLNLRVNPNTGDVVDGDPMAPGVQPDTKLNPGAPFLTAAAYTNNFQGAATTTLYALDPVTDKLVTIGGLNGAPSPNLGQVTSVGGLGVNITGATGFEITQSGDALAVVQTLAAPLVSRLARINLATGQMTLLGKIGLANQVIDGLAELPREEVVYGVTASNRLVRFRADEPGTFLSSSPISGLAMGENVVGLDVRPATGELFALTSTNRILRIDPATGQGIVSGAALDVALLAAGSSGFDFNPSVDRLRLVNDGNDNLRYNPVTFAPVDGDAATPGVQGDTDLAFLGTDVNAGANPNAVAAAYDRNDNDPATATTLFLIDSALNAVVRQGAVDGNAADTAGGGGPNGGLLTTIGGLGVNVTDVASFDITGVGSGANGVALAALQVEGETVSKLFRVNLANGSATLVGTIGKGGELIRAMAIAPPTFSFSAAGYGVREAAGAATITIRRHGGSSGPASVQFTVSDGSAVAGSDYSPLSVLVTFAAGETFKTVQVGLLNDNVVEPNETANLTLSSPTGALLGPQSTAVLFIANDDFPPAASPLVFGLTPPRRGRR